MNSLSRTTWFLALVAMFPAAFAHAAAIDDAKAQLAQKNYEAVDKILSQDLAVRTPSAEALRVSLAAAIEAGKPVTAESRLVVLLKQQQDPQLLLTGAKIAEILSDEPLALTRYLAYGRAETQKHRGLGKRAGLRPEARRLPGGVPQVRGDLRRHRPRLGPGRDAVAPLRRPSRRRAAAGPGRLPDAEVARPGAGRDRAPMAVFGLRRLPLRPRAARSLLAGGRGGGKVPPGQRRRT